MSDLPQNKQDIVGYFSQEQFVIDTCSQINKDLNGLTQLFPEFDIDMEGDVLAQVTRQLANCLKEMSSANLQQYIYRVDMKEADFHHALTQEDDCQELAYFVVRREAQKVYLRRKFS
jgi:hypothetical protein